MAKPVSPIKRINSLYSKCLDLIEVEVEHLRCLAIANKLARDPAKDLRDIVKLLEGMKDAHAAIIADKKSQAESRAKGADDATLIAKIKET